MSGPQRQTATPGAARTLRRLVVLALGAILLGAAAGHAAAMAAYRASGDAASAVTARLDAARVAAALEPWSAPFAWRVSALEGRVLLDAGRVDDAYRVLEPLSTVVRGDAVYRQTYQAAVARKAPLDARKAHQQHAREQADGGLRPEDVIP